MNQVPPRQRIKKTRRTTPMIIQISLSSFGIALCSTEIPSKVLEMNLF